MSKDNFCFIDEVVEVSLGEKHQGYAWAKLSPKSKKAFRQGFKAAMLERLPQNWTDEPPETIAVWLEEHPQVSPELPENARLQVAYSRAFGYNQALDDVRVALETLVNREGDVNG